MSLFAEHDKQCRPGDNIDNACTCECARCWDQREQRCLCPECGDEYHDHVRRQT